MNSVVDVEREPMRSVIVWALAACAAVAMAPWFSGGEEAIAKLIGAGALLVGALFLWREPVSRRLTHGPLIWLYVALVGWATLSLTWSANHYSTVLWTLNLVAAGLVFRLAYAAAGEEEGRKRLVGLYLVSAIIFCLYGLYLYVTGDYERFTSVIYWANPAAAYLIPAILVSLAMLTAKGRQWWFWAAAVTLFTTSFILTDSRGGTLVALLVIGLFLFVQRRKKAFWIHLLFSVIGIILLTTAMVQIRANYHHNASGGAAKAALQAPGSRFTEAATGESQSVSDRLNYLKSAFVIWGDHPVRGSGAGTYGDVHPQYQRTVVSASSSVHNTYVQTLAELGLVGALLLIYLVAVALFGGLRGVTADHSVLPLYLGLVGLLLHFGLDIDAHYPALVLLAAALAGLCYRQRAAAPRRASVVLPVTAIALLVLCLSLYQSETFAAHAAAFQSDGDYETAAYDYGRAHSGLLYNPDYVNAEGIDLYTMASAGGSSAKADTALALARAKAAQNLDPHDGQHHQLEGRILELGGDYAGAERAFKAALALDQYNHPDYATDLASVQAQQGDTKAAMITAQTMLGRYPTVVVLNRNADVTLRPNLATLAAVLGNIQLRAGDLSGAAASSKLALSYDPTNLRARALAVQVAKLSAPQQ